MAKDEQFHKKVNELRKVVARIVAEKVAQRAESGVTITVEAGGPDCALCEDASWWEEEFGDLAAWAKCQTCGPDGWGCPGDYCGAA